MGAKHRREIWNSRKQTSPRLCRSRKAQPTSPERFVGQEKHKKGGEKSHAKTLRLRQQPRMNQPSREASSFVPDPRNYGGQDGGQAADLRRWRYGDGAVFDSSINSGFAGRLRSWFCGWSQLVLRPGHAFGLGRLRFGRIAIYIYRGGLGHSHGIDPK